MNNRYQKIFVWTILILMCLPLTYIVGMKEPTTISGVDKSTELPSIQEKSFENKKFQSQFEGWWNSHFAFRKSMLKLKNQIYDWLNFGKIHSGFKSIVIQGEEGYLYEKGYFSSYSKDCQKLPNSIIKIKTLNEILKAKGIDLFVVLAPNKAVTYSDFIPKRYRYFLGDDCEYYDKIEKELKKMGIKVFNSQPITSKIKKEEKYEPFSKTGTHWNHYGAGRIVQEASSFFGWGKIEMTDIESRKKPYTMERDIANLLNLLIEYETNEKFYKPMYQKRSPLPGVTTIIGNSFSNEFVKNFMNAGLADNVCHFENKPLTSDDIYLINKSKRIIFVYTDLALINENGQFYKKIDFLLETLPTISKK